MIFRLWVLAVGFSLMGFSVCRAADSSVKVASPDGKIEFTLNPSASGRLEYQASCDGRAVLLPSALGVSVDGQDLGAQATLGAGVAKEIDEQYPMLGGHSKAVNRCREMSIPVISGLAKTNWVLEVRAYNDGVAFRYRVPGTGTRHVDGEATTWQLPPGGMAWFQPHNSRKDYEATYQTAALADLRERSRPAPPATTSASRPVAQIPPPPMIATPVAVKTTDGLFLMVTEANLIDYSDMALECVDDTTLKAFFHNQRNGWDWTGEIISPWRVTLIARDLNTLANSDLVRNLCPPPAPELANADWIVPGRSTWHWMVVGRPKFADQHQWVDWTKQLGFEQYIIDDGWIRWTSEDGQRDAWACLKEVVDYAHSQNVKIWAWVNSKELRDDATRQAYMSKARSIGIVGLKIDFMKPGDVTWVKWYDDTLRDAARNHLMLDFHGALKSSGRERTWPNELTREAVKGREGGKQTGLHDATLPFTRYVQGPADYTPTDFRAEKLKGSSWAHELSMAIVFTSPLLCYGGSPENYLQNEAVDIVKSIPATWDETIVLPSSEIGTLAAFARRKGDTWFIGVLNGGEQRQFKCSLPFLNNGNYKIDELADSADQPDAWKRTERSVTASDSITANLRKDGGYIARLVRAR